MAYETVLYDIADRVCTITLNRPEKLNAWTRQMHVDLREAMQKAGGDESVRAIILTGAGRGFCAGADMGGLQAIGSGSSADRSTTAHTDLPGGKTIAHGFLTLSLIPMLNHQISHINNVRNGINYGCNKVRFTSPVPAGSRVRARAKLLAAEAMKGGGVRLTNEMTIEIEGQEKPACVAETMSIVYGS